MEWKVPLSDISFDDSEEQAAVEVIRSRWLSMGAKTQLFEKRFGEFTGSKHALAVSNCTAALHLAHNVLGLKPGDEVIVPSLTFIATINTVLATGATPVFADVESLDNWCISARTVEPLINPKTVGLVVMHYGGYPANMTDIVKLCDSHNLYLIEDCAHSLGAYWNGVHTGRFGQFGCFSFFANKNLSTGEGGMIITDNDELAEKVRLVRSHGMTTLTWQRHKGHAFSYDVTVLGYNYRMDEIRSALGLVQLSKLVEANKKRAVIVAEYRKRLAEIPNIFVPFSEHPGQSSYHIFPILLDKKIERNTVISGMMKKQIQVSIHYPAGHLFTYIRSHLGTKEGMLPLTEKISESVLTLPLFADMTIDQVEMVVSALDEELSK
ncbi:MAG: DegT/DnrJ/EryC1/StrS family aminotransferase [Sedimentisphaerales bacterium]